MAITRREPAKPFTRLQINMLETAVAGFTETQLGAMADPLTGEQLKLLFVPDEYRKALSMVYECEEEGRANGTIVLDLACLSKEQRRVFPESDVYVHRGTLTIYFYRANTPDGFVTPSPLFGNSAQPIKDFRGMPPEELRNYFLDSLEQTLRVFCQWKLVHWVLFQLQDNMRTPQQIRWVWPCIATLGKNIEHIDLSQPSVRAGLNASAPLRITKLLQPTNDTVLNAVLLGTKDDLIAKWRRGDYRISASIDLGDNLIV